MEKSIHHLSPGNSQNLTSFCFLTGCTHMDLHGQAKKKKNRKMIRGGNLYALAPTLRKPANHCCVKNKNEV